MWVLLILLGTVTPAAPGPPSEQCHDNHEFLTPFSDCLQDQAASKLKLIESTEAEMWQHCREKCNSHEKCSYFNFKVLKVSHHLLSLISIMNNIISESHDWKSKNVYSDANCFQKWKRLDFWAHILCDKRYFEETLHHYFMCYLFYFRVSSR